MIDAIGFDGFMFGSRCRAKHCDVGHCAAQLCSTDTHPTWCETEKTMKTDPSQIYPIGIEWGLLQGK